MNKRIIYDYYYDNAKIDGWFCIIDNEHPYSSISRSVVETRDSDIWKVSAIEDYIGGKLYTCRCDCVNFKIKDEYLSKEFTLIYLGTNKESADAEMEHIFLIGIKGLRHDFQV